MAATITIPTTFKAVDKFSKIVGKMTKHIKTFGKEGAASVKRLDHKITGAFKKMSKLGQLALGLSIGAIFVTAFNDVKLYETGLVGVSKTTGIVGDELKELSKDFIDLSDNLRGVEASKLTDLGQVAGQLGVTGSKNILKFSGTMAKLEKASDIAGEEGASSIARLLTITGQGVGVIDQFGAAIVGLGNTSAATESEILAVSSEVARSTAAYKLQAHEILGIATTLKSLDVAPQAAGTAVGKVFSGIELATIKGGKVLRNYGKVMGMTSKEVKQAFAEDPKKAFTSFIKGLNRISNEGGSVSKALLDVGLNSQTVTKGIIPLATNYNLLTDKLKQSSTEWEKNSALNNEFEAATRTTQTALDDIKKSFTNVILKQATAGSGLEKLQNILFYVSDNIETVIVVLSTLVGLFVLMKAVVLASTIAVTANSIAMGFAAASTGAMSIAMKGNMVAQGAFKAMMFATAIATKVMTAAQWLLNIAMDANPIGLIILGIAALIGLVVLITTKYDEWGASLLMLLGPLGWIINLIVSLSRNWDMIKKSFSEGGIVEGLKAIGRVILDSVLSPMQQFLGLIAKIPGMGDLANGAIDRISKIKQDLGIDITPEEDGSLASTTQASNENVSKTVTETNKNSNVRLDIIDKGGNVGEVSTDDDIPVTVGSTTGAS